MTQSFVCEAFEANGTIARYVAGQLDDEKSAEFEDHFLTCERCQHSIAAGFAVRSAPHARRRRSFTLVWVPVALAASLVGVIGLRAYRVQQLRQLGAVQVAPIFLGSPMRSAGEEAGTFDSAMAAYNRADYPRATSLLRKLATTSAAAEPVVPFFEGASELMHKQPADAESAFTQVIAAGPSVYRAEAYFYRAKTRLQRGERAGAIADLKAAVQEQRPISDDAARLLDKLER